VSSICQQDKTQKRSEGKEKLTNREGGEEAAKARQAKAMSDTQEGRRKPPLLEIGGYYIPLLPLCIA
jgi:hypothetical protein